MRLFFSTKPTDVVSTLSVFGKIGAGGIWQTTGARGGGGGTGADGGHGS